MANSGSEKYMPVRANESSELYMTEGGIYTATIWSEPSGLWAAAVNGPGGASVCHGLPTFEGSRALCRAQVATFVARAKTKGHARQEAIVPPLEDTALQAYHLGRCVVPSTY